MYKNPTYLKLCWNHRGSPKKFDPSKYNGKIRIISIDPGVVNYAFRVEDRYEGGKVKTVYMKLMSFQKEHRRYKDLTDYLDSKHLYIKSCDLILIEEQLGMSTNAYGMSRHTVAYFMVKTRNRYKTPLIYEVSPRLKTHILSKDTPKRTKTWAVKLAKEMLAERGDTKSLEVVNNIKKKDDICDTIVQLEAFMIHLGMKKYISWTF